MRLKQLLTAMVLTCSGTLQTNAQIAPFLNEEQFRASVNLVDEFIARFNGDKEKPGTDKQDKDYETNRILYLFNGKMSFPDFTRHFFTFYTALLYTFSKTILKE